MTYLSPIEYWTLFLVTVYDGDMNDMDDMGEVIINSEKK